MRADDDIDLTGGQIFGDGFLLFGADKTRHNFDAHWPIGETVAEILIMLLGQQRGRHQYRHLFTALYGDKRRPHRHFGFAEADIAADHPVHRLRAFHVG